MSLPVPVIVYVLAALGLVVVVLTRVRLRRESPGGHAQVPRWMLNAHTVLGVVGLAAWVTYLIAPESSPAGKPVVGLFGLACLWLVVPLGLLFLVRWLPIHGRHASDREDDTWSEGPGLSILAHVGMLVAVLIDSVAFMFEQV